MFYDFSRYGLLAFIALIAVTPYAAYQYKQRPAAEAAMFALVLTWMFGPNLADFDFPFMPPYGKTDWAAIGAALGLALYAGRRVDMTKPGRGLDLFILLMCFGDLASFLTNRDALLRGPTLQPGLTLTDAVYYIEQDLVGRGLPLFIGRACFRRRADGLAALRLFVTFGLIYTPLILWEVRMSPQLHRQVYGYGMNYSFVQSIRDGGFRPEVFLQHGLILGMFVMTVTFAAVALYKVGRKKVLYVPMGIVCLIFLGVTVLVKAKAALLFTFGGSLVLYRIAPRAQVLICCLIAMTIPTYAYLHISEQFPAEELLQRLEPFGEERLQSMQFRLDNELSLVLRAKERMAFGWGGYERERIFDELGRNVSVQDGAWIIVLGLRGMVGFVSFFGALIIPLFYALFKIGKLKDERDKRILAFFCMVTAMLTLNMLPNMAIDCLPFLMAGGTMGLSSGLVSEQSKRRRQQKQARRAQQKASKTPSPPDDEPNPPSPPRPDRKDDGGDPTWEEPSVIINIPTNIR